MRTSPATHEFASETARFFSENLVRFREDRHFTKGRAAIQLGVAQSTWSQWESGKRFPPGHLLNLIARLFGVSPCMLLSEGPCPRWSAGRWKNESLANGSKASQIVKCEDVDNHS